MSMVDSADEQMTLVRTRQSAASRAKATVINRDTMGSFPSGSRYIGHMFVKVHQGDRTTRTIETWERPILPPYMETGTKYYYIQNKDAYRPDLIAINAYGNKDYWWWVMYSNKLFDVTQLKPGLTLVINRPPIEMPRVRTFEG